MQGWICWDSSGNRYFFSDASPWAFEKRKHEFVTIVRSEGYVED